MEHQIVFFDGVCNLCTSTVKFIIPRDTEDKFRFVALQTDTAKELLKLHPIDPEQAGTVLLLKDGRLYQKSSAALQIASELGGIWPMLKVFMLIPRFIRDFIYERIANNRYRIWGKQESCLVPTPELKAKFL